MGLKVTCVICVCLPVIGAHSPVEDSYRPVTEASDDEGALGVTWQAGHTAVRSCGDVLTNARTKTQCHFTWNPRVEIINGVLCRRLAHFKLDLHRYSATGPARLYFLQLHPSRQWLAKKKTKPAQHFDISLPLRNIELKCELLRTMNVSFISPRSIKVSLIPQD